MSCEIKATCKLFIWLRILWKINIRSDQNIIIIIILLDSTDYIYYYYYHHHHLYTVGNYIRFIIRILPWYVNVKQKKTCTP